MSGNEDLLRLAGDKWVPVAVAKDMIRAVAPPHRDAGWAQEWLQREVGTIRSRLVPGGMSQRETVTAARRGRKVPAPEYERNLADLILRLLASKATQNWPVPAETILSLATLDPAELPALTLQRLMAAAPPAKGKGGAPQKYPWSKIGAAFGAWLHEKPGRAQLPFPKCYDAVVDLMYRLGEAEPPDKETVRNYVKEWKAAYLATLGRPDDS